MKLFKTPTRNPDLYESKDAEALRRRVRELEEVVEKYRTKRVGPYNIVIRLGGPDWPGISSHLKHFAEVAEKHGPDGMPVCGSSSGGYSYSIELESNLLGAPGESGEDLRADEQEAE